MLEVGPLGTESHHDAVQLLPLLAVIGQVGGHVVTFVGPVATVLHVVAMLPLPVLGVGSAADSVQACEGIGRDGLRGSTRQRVTNPSGDVPSVHVMPESAGGMTAAEAGCAGNQSDTTEFVPQRSTSAKFAGLQAALLHVSGHLSWYCVAAVSAGLDVKLVGCHEPQSFRHRRAVTTV